MISDNLGQKLHDKSTRGLELSAIEKTQLQEWYDYQDALEQAEMKIIADVIVIPSLKEQISSTIDELTRLTEIIKKVSNENNAIQKQNEVLRKKIAYLFEGQPAA